ncbi:hypothetical protein BLL52_1388 [Rhodoferax antarcticus ANT.BR]|uniref:Uncharacterized protein n=1 Tax=Rhodoferax antarcticus ANT.BR TaxID=1111071 RepID=A0A1Q8YHM0_9BURK|nr:hypothetical protein BLL52_1388 [Rhodoferax antarcticus ANT.BR]
MLGHAGGLQVRLRRIWRSRCCCIQSRCVCASAPRVGDKQFPAGPPQGFSKSGGAKLAFAGGKRTRSAERGG